MELKVKLNAEFSDECNIYIGAPQDQVLVQSSDVLSNYLDVCTLPKNHLTKFADNTKEIQLTFDPEAMKSCKNSTSGLWVDRKRKMRFTIECKVMHLGKKNP